MSRIPTTPPQISLDGFRRALRDGLRACATPTATRWKSVMGHRKVFVTSFLGFCVLSGGLVFFLGRDFFPNVDAGQFRLACSRPGRPEN